MKSIYLINKGWDYDRGRRPVLFGMLLLFIVLNYSCGGRSGNADQSRSQGKMQQGADSGMSGGRALDTVAENIAAGVYSNGTATQKEVMLPDGTKLMMHAGTSVHLSRGLNWGERALWLDGDALFELAPSSGKPFGIDTRDLAIRARIPGTTFRVNARRREAGEEVDVLTGEVKVMKSYHSNSDNEPEIIRAGEMVMINRDIDLMEKEKMDSTDMKGWK